MVKKKRKDKEVAKLRREVEVLRAQLKNESKYQGVKVSMKKGAAKAPPVEGVAGPPLADDVRPDLRKTAILTAACLGILVVLCFTQSWWSEALSGL